MSYPKLTPIIAKGATEPRYLEDRFADVVNVKDFGAKGDGETDDTEAVQTAVETGQDVYFPAGTYLISESISCTQSGQRFYGESGIPTGSAASGIGAAGLSSVIHSTVEADSALFDVKVPQVEFANIGFYSDGSADSDSTICFNALADSNTDDIDFYITDCFINNFTTGAKVYGRCLTALRNLFANCSHSIIIDWPSSGTVISVEAQGPILGHRALRIQNNRFHHVTKAVEIVNTSEDTTLRLRAGDISNNTMDVGGILVYATGDVDALKIQGNICDLGNSSYVQFLGSNTTNVLINGNVFHGDPYDGTEPDVAGSGVAPYAGILVSSDNVNGFIVTSNSFAKIDGYALTFQNSDADISNVNFSFNNCNGIGQDLGATRSIVRTDASIDGFVCIGNSGENAGAQNLVRGASTASTMLTRAYILNNAVTFASANCIASATVSSGIYHPEGGSLSVLSGNISLGDTNNVLGLKMTRSGTASVGMQAVNNNGKITLVGTPTGNEDGAWNPLSDNAVDLGTGSYRFAVVHAGTGSISTSDVREKTSVENASESLMRAWGKVNFKVFKFLDAVAKKGIESARIHVGVIAQQVQTAFASEGLDASRYGLFCYDEWEAKEAELDEGGNIIVPLKEAGNRYGIRYEEALALECAYQRWRLEQLEERINQLTNSNN